MGWTDFDRGGDIVFFAPIGLLNIIGLLLVMLSGYHLYAAGDQAGLATMFTALIFLLMYFGFHALQFYSTSVTDDTEVEQYWNSTLDTPQELSLILVLGFVLWYAFAGLQAGAAQSVVGDTPVLSTVADAVEQVPAMPQSVLMSSATADIEPAYSRFANVISAPFTEEAFFLVGLPLALLLILSGIGLQSRLLKYSLVLLIVSPLFASFHVAETTFSAFWIAAFGFSMLVRGLTVIDYVARIVPGIAVMAPFAIGAHIANNMVQTGGIVDFVRVMAGEPLLVLLVGATTSVYLYWAYQGAVQGWNRVMGESNGV